MLDTGWFIHCLNINIYWKQLVYKLKTMISTTCNKRYTSKPGTHLAQTNSVFHLHCTMAKATKHAKYPLFSYVHLWYKRTSAVLYGLFSPTRPPEGAGWPCWSGVVRRAHQLKPPLLVQHTAALTSLETPPRTNVIAAPSPNITRGAHCSFTSMGCEFPSVQFPQV